ncbi:MAG: MFS transporter [Pirellulales bacterium]|nr:MFS transporter [Pirellulales bacterium]
MAYAANTLIMVAVSLLYRYADFVTLLGGTELHLGWIVGVGMVGSLAMRLALGASIDHYGPRAVWLGSLTLFAASCFAHLAVGTCNGPAIYLLRIAWCCAVAGIFGATMTFVSARASVERMAEMIGMLGTSGFLGMVLGTQLGDLLLGTETISWWQTRWMFVVAGLLACGAMLFVWLATRQLGRPVWQPRPPLVRLLRRHLSARILLVGIAMGIGLSLPGTFLRTYSAELDIPRMGLFFGVYAPTAVVTRILTRRLPERFGTTPMILLGIGGLAASQLLLLAVRSEWQLVVPGISYGFSHAVLFPSVVAAGSSAFPLQHRGLATTLMLGTWDAGQLVGAPMAGAIVHYSGLIGLPSYPTMFVTMACLMGAIGVGYALTGRRRSPLTATCPPAPDSSRSIAADLPQSLPVAHSPTACGPE